MRCGDAATRSREPSCLMARMRILHTLSAAAIVAVIAFPPPVLSLLSANSFPVKGELFPCYAPVPRAGVFPPTLLKSNVFSFRGLRLACRFSLFFRCYREKTRRNAAIQARPPRDWSDAHEPTRHR